MFVACGILCLADVSSVYIYIFLDALNIFWLPYIYFWLPYIYFWLPYIYFWLPYIYFWLPYIFLVDVYKFFVAVYIYSCTILSRLAPHTKSSLCRRLDEKVYLFIWEN